MNDIESSASSGRPQMSLPVTPGRPQPEGGLTKRHVTPLKQKLPRIDRLSNSQMAAEDHLEVRK